MNCNSEKRRNNTRRSHSFLSTLRLHRVMGALARAGNMEPMQFPFNSNPCLIKMGDRAGLDLFCEVSFYLFQLFEKNFIRLNNRRLANVLVKEITEK
ncbi:MAG: hypothetical protein APF81_08095 [Desulfosporosinus sp. BRH_c37]|nr:MAG: hypothetical protein APF81_08095 [Desulfosporosinus sp. BRH_c37]